MDIRPCTPADVEPWVALRAAIWSDYPVEALREGLEAMLDPAHHRAVALLCRVDSREAVAFAEATLRTDHVNGCETSPVVFLEGIYVAPGYRRRGIARALAADIAEWGRGRGCTEFASDALLDNAASHAFHAAIGFAETERVVYFRRQL